MRGDHVPFTIIGVAEKGFNGTDIGAPVDVCAPLMMQAQLGRNHLSDRTNRRQLKGPDGRIMHAAVHIGDSMVEIGDATEAPMPANLHMYVDDVDGMYQRAIAAGGVSLREPTTTLYGERSAGVRDTGGNGWWLACHVEDVSPEELERRSKAHSDKD